MSPHAIGRPALETSEQYNRRVARDRVLREALDTLRRVGWFIATHTIAFGAGVLIWWSVAPERFVYRPIYLTQAAPARPAAALLQFQCNPSEHAEYHEACKGRKRMESVK